MRVSGYGHQQPDPSDGRGSERAVRFPEEGITEVLERITDDFFAVDREWRYTYLNGRVLRRIRSAKGEALTREQLLGKSMWEVFPDLVGSVFYHKYHEALREQKHTAFEAYFSTAEEWYEVRAYPSESGLSIYFRDVTERRRAEGALEESHTLLQSIIEQTADAIFVKDTEDRYLLINSPGARMMGMPVHEIVGKRTTELFPSDVASILLEADRQVIGSGESLTYEEHLPGMGVAQTFLTTKVPYRDRQGGVVGVLGVARDITERKQGEEGLRRSEERFRAQYEGFPIPTISWRKLGDDFELADYNSAADRLPQGRMSDLVGVRANEFYAGSPEITGALSRCHDEGVTIYQEKAWRMRTTGEDKHLGVTFAYVPPDLVMTHAEDITERKRAEAALEESNTLLRSIIEGTPDPIFLKDTRGRYLLANSATAEVMGRSAEELLGKDNAELMPPDVAGRIMAVDRRVMETDEPQTGEERIIVRGVARTYLYTKAPYRNSQREVVGIIGVARDITGRKRAEEGLRHANERLHSLVRHSSDITTILTADGIARYQSPAIERVLGYTPEELVGKEIFDYVHPEDLERVMGTFDHLLDNAAANPLVELRFRHKDGSWRNLEAIGSNLLRDPSVEGLVVNSRDTTERRLLHEDQQRFLTNAAHQLKTPITTIVGAAELLVTKQDLD
ncbi:MAG TPA: PAS domain-containing protein, partial [Rubrobacter sp.]|nr:PAS domain-containing protein [Rubrobacter sp.]